jgi:serine carboxypeptidase-like clade I
MLLIEKLQSRSVYISIKHSTSSRRMRTLYCNKGASSRFLNATMVLILRTIVVVWMNFCLGSIFFCDAAPVDDLIETLPLYGKTPTVQYSGYLNATDGCDTSINGQCYIHYWFVAAEGKCCDEPKPTILWLNGGPGSSSIFGLLQELGPLLINATGGLMQNPYAWTKVANILVLESPVGVGYSYCTKQQQGGICQNTDTYTARASRAALVDFFTSKFPELVPNDFYITGESYAGVYVPTLAYEIVTNAPHINLKGIAVGDPCTDNKAQDISMDPLWYGYKYGLVDDATYDTLWNKCNVRLGRKYHQHENTMKMKQTIEIISSTSDKTIATTTTSFQRNNRFLFENLLSKQKYPLDAKQNDQECRIAYRKFVLSTSGGLSQGWKDLYIDDYSLYAPVSNQEDDDMNVYMNRLDVRQALHVDDTSSFITQWPYPKHGFHYKKEYKACSDINDDTTLSMIDFYRKLSTKLDRIWIYNGDTDPCVSYEGTRTAVKWIGYNEIDGGSYRPWFYNLTATTVDLLQEKAIMFGPNLLLQNVGAQFGGEVVNYENNVTFFTIHGAGHMVPQFRPHAALHFITKFVNGQDLTPLLPSNATLAQLSEDEFEVVLDTWTETAMKAPYVV